MAIRFLCHVKIKKLKLNRKKEEFLTSYKKMKRKRQRQRENGRHKYITQEDKK